MKIHANYRYNGKNGIEEIGKTVGWAVAGEIIPRTIAKPLGKVLVDSVTVIMEQHLGIKVSLVEEVVNLNSDSNNKK